MTDKRGFFKLDASYILNPKIATLLDASKTAVLLHIASIGYAAQHLTDGIVPVALLRRMLDACDEDAQLLFDAGLWIDRGDGTAEIRDYLKHQRSAEEAKGAAEKAKRAAEKRWNATEHASGIAVGMPDPMPRERERKRENTAPPAAFSEWWQAYPKKVAKGNAVKAYKTAIKKIDHAALVAATVAYAGSVEGADPKFIPHPASWLNGERWDDVPVKASSRVLGSEDWMAP